MHFALLLLLRFAALDPASYASPSGSFVLEVDPTDRDGAGPSQCRLLHDGREQWCKALPFTFRDVAVTDTGVSAGYALTKGPDRAGQIVIAFVDAAGASLREHRVPRQESRGPDGSPTPLVDDVVALNAEDRLFIRLLELPRASAEETWWSFALSTGERLPDAAPPPEIVAELAARRTRSFTPGMTVYPRLDLRLVGRQRLPTSDLPGFAPSTAAIDALGRILVIDAQSRDLYAFTAAGTRRTRIAHCGFLNRDTLAFNLAGERDGNVLLQFEWPYAGRFPNRRFDRTGRRLEPLPIAQTFAPAAAPDEYWAMASTGTLTLRDASNTVLRTIDRRPDRRWLRLVLALGVDSEGTTVAVQPDGLLFIGVDGSQEWHTVGRFSLAYVERCVMTRDWVIAIDPWRARLHRRVDRTTFEWRPWELGHAFMAYGTSPDEREFWALDSSGAVLDRYALPQE